MSLEEVAVQAYPVSVKGVVARDGRVLLLHNERGEWELPGGRLEIGETPEQCVVREIAEETGWTVTAGPILDAWLYHITQAGQHVLIVTYACQLKTGQEATDPVLSDEHERVGLFTPGEIADLVMPQGYKNSIAAWLARHALAEVTARAEAEASARLSGRPGDVSGQRRQRIIGSQHSAVSGRQGPDGGGH